MTNQNSVTVAATRLRWIVCAPQRLIDNIGGTAVEATYYAALAQIDNGEVSQYKIGTVEAGIGGEFQHTS